MIEYLSLRDVVELHEIACGPAPLLDPATLEAQVARPRAGFGGHETFPTLHEKAAALLHGAASTQCFEDGNKRAAWVVTVFLELNGADLRDIPEIEAEAFVIAVATNAWTDRTLGKAAEWLKLQTSGWPPTRHPQLDYAFVAEAATAEDSGVFSTLRGALHGFTASTDWPMPLSLAVACRVFWTPQDVRRSHRLAVTMLPKDSQDPVAGGVWNCPSPLPSGHAHHPHGLMPNIAAIPVFGVLERPGRYDVRLTLDDAELTTIPFNVVAVLHSP